MDENLHSIDDIFKKAINEYEDSPSLKVSEHLEKNLERRQVVSITRKYKKWKWVAAALLIFSVGMAMYTINLRIKYREATGRNKLKAPSVKKHSISSDKTALNNKNTQAPIQQTNDNGLSKNKKGIPGIHKNNSTQVVSNNRVVQNKYADKSFQRARNYNMTLNNQKQSSTNTSRTQVENNGLKKDNGNASVSKGMNGLHNNPIVTNKADKDKIVTLSHQKSNATVMPNKTDNIKPNEKIKEDEQAINLPFLQRINLKDYLAIETNSLLNIPPASRLQIGQLPPTLNLNIPPSYAATNNKTKVSVGKKFAANVFVSIDNVATHLTNDHPSFREDDKNKIKHDEDRSNAYTVGVSGQLNLTNKIGIEAGFSLSTITTNINAKTIFARPDNRGNVNYRISCSSGYAYVSTKSGARPNQGDSITALSSKNTLQYFSVPVGLQYIMSFGKFELRPAFVVSTNIRTKSEVQTVLSTAVSNENTATNAIEGLKPVYFDAGPRLDAVYNLSSVIGIGVTPSARFALSSTTKDGPVKTYLNSFGIAATIKIKL